MENANAKQVGFIVACKEFFGFKPEQTLMTFRDEVAELTREDKEEIRAGLIALGFDIKPL